MNIKDKWVIEEVYSSEDCRHIYDPWDNRGVKFCTNTDNNKDNWIKCNKENCPLKPGKGE